MNQQNKVLQNVSARQAINQTIDRKSFVNTLLNDGSTSTLGLVQKLCKRVPEGKDFRTANGDLTKVDTKSAQELWKKLNKSLVLKR